MNQVNKNHKILYYPKLNKILIKNLSRRIKFVQLYTTNSFHKTFSELKINSFEIK